MPIHPLERLKERYRDSYGLDDLRAIEALLRNGNAKEVGKVHKGLREYLVTYQKKRVRVLFSSDTGHAVTILPLCPKPAPKRRTIFRDGRIRALVT